MRLRFHPAALAEGEEAIRYYDVQGEGLGNRFAEEVENRLALIVADPERWRVRPDGARRVNGDVFPYYIAYVIRADVIWIVSISHAHRQPGHWSNRLDSLSS